MEAKQIILPEKKEQPKEPQRNERPSMSKHYDVFDRISEGMYMTDRNMTQVRNFRTAPGWVDPAIRAYKKRKNLADDVVMTIDDVIAGLESEEAERHARYEREKQEKETKRKEQAELGKQLSQQRQDRKRDAICERLISGRPMTKTNMKEMKEYRESQAFTEKVASAFKQRKKLADDVVVSIDDVIAGLEREEAEARAECERKWQEKEAKRIMMGKPPREEAVCGTLTQTPQEVMQERALAKLRQEEAALKQQRDMEAECARIQPDSEPAEKRQKT
jgi:hypothetical protein